MDKIDLMQNPDLKAGVQMSKENLANYIHVKKKLFIQNRIKERFLPEMRIMAAPTQVNFFPEFDRKFQQLFEAGLFDFYERDCFDNPKKFEKRWDPYKVLTFEELEASFVVSVAPLLLACFVFFIEWVLSFKNLLVFHQIFRAFFAMQRV